MKTLEETTTLFIIEVGTRTWYLDYNPEKGIYEVHKDEVFRSSFSTKGEALEYIFNTLGGTQLRLIGR